MNCEKDESTVDWKDMSANERLKTGNYEKMDSDDWDNLEPSQIANNVDDYSKIPTGQMSRCIDDLSAGRRGELTKDQIAAVEDKSKLGDLGNYDPTAMQQAIQDEYPNADVEPADGMKLTDDGKLTYQGSDIDLSSFEEDKNINVQDGELMVDKKTVSKVKDMEGVETTDTQGKAGQTINLNQLGKGDSMFPGSPAGDRSGAQDPLPRMTPSRQPTTRRQTPDRRIQAKTQASRTRRTAISCTA